MNYSITLYSGLIVLELQQHSLFYLFVVTSDCQSRAHSFAYRLLHGQRTTKKMLSIRNPNVDTVLTLLGFPTIFRDRNPYRQPEDLPP